MIGVIILVFGVLWVGEMIRRFPRDLAEYRAARDWGERVATLILWGVTLMFIGVIGRFVWSVAHPIWKALRAHHIV